ncbi:MAG: hypothetical protein ACOYL6_01420 [Bacteriovoracaceae bacterium]
MISMVSLALSFSLLMLSLSTNSWASNFSYEGSFGGQIKTMGRKAESPDLWATPATFSMIHGNLNSKSVIEKGKLETSVFYRRTDTDLYKTLNFTRELLVFPRNLVAREMIDLTKQKNEPDYRSDLLIHRFSYEHEWNKLRLEFGRFFINYGLGETFNPVNTFNLPNGLFIINDLSQASDGARATYFYNEKIDFVFYSLGSKDYADSTHPINPTLFLQATIRHEDWQYLFVGGADEKKNKVGGEVSLRFSDYLGFIQTLYQSSNNREAALIDGLVGLDRQLTELWHVRLEVAYQEIPKNQTFNTRLLPQELTVAIAQEYELHPLFKIKPVLTMDPKNYLIFGILKGTLSLTQNLEIEAFALGNLNQNPGEENLRQRLLTRDLGLRGQYYF